MQIEGLKDKNIQNSINEKLKGKAYSLKNSNVYTYVSGNFANILSVYMYNNMEEIETLNVDLATGEEIKFEKIFISSATINAYLADALYELLAWNELDFEGEMFDDSGWNDMNKKDTSDYEEKFLMLINNYNKNKDYLKYIITPNSVVLYGLIDEKIISNEYVNEIGLEINLIKYIDEVAMYKRFITNTNIYENETLGQKDTIVFTGGYWDEQNIQRINYGRIQSNIFIEEVINPYSNEKKETILSYIYKISDEDKTKLIKENKTDIGIFYQRSYDIVYNERYGYYSIVATTYQANCSSDYFKNAAFLDYIKLKDIDSADSSLIGFTEHYSKMFPKLNILPSKYETYYIRENGELLGKNYTDENGQIVGESYEDIEGKLDEEMMREQMELEEERLNEEANNIINSNVINNNIVNTIDNNTASSTTNIIESDY